MKHLAAVSALIIATDNAVISTEARIVRVTKAATDFLNVARSPGLAVYERAAERLEAALVDLSTLSGDVGDAHEHAVVLAFDLFEEASEDCR